MTVENMVDRVTAELRRAGLSARADTPASGGFGVEASAAADARTSRRTWPWTTRPIRAGGAGVRSPARRRRERSIVLRMGQVLEAMAEAMLAILTSADLDAQMSSDDLAPATVVVTAIRRPDEDDAGS